MIDLMGKKYYFFAFSILLIITGVVFYFINGVKLDITFEGGTILEMQMADDKFDTDKAVDIIYKTINKEVTAQKSKDTARNVYLLTISVPKESTLTGDEQNKVVDALRSEFNIKADSEMYVQKVEPFIGKEIMMDGLKAVFWASLLIILYVWWRFKMMSGLSAGVMAVIALLHDAAIMLAVYIVFKIPLNESFIAAVLTILGYSMNDTIIIYDRIRENSNLLRKIPIAELVNKSIVQTLSRSINTVVTVLICIVTVYVFSWYHNIESLKEFTLPLIVGIASGCYSSIFIASPLWVLWKESQAKKNIKGKTARA